MPIQQWRSELARGDFLKLGSWFGHRECPKRDRGIA